MLRIKFVGAMALLAAVVCPAAQASAPVMPPGSVGSNTLAVIHTDSTLMTPEILRTAAKTVMGPNASRAEEFIGKFQEKYDKATKAGVEALTVVITAAKKPADDAAGAASPVARHSTSPDVVVYLQLKPGSDVKAVEAAITEDMKPVDRENAVFAEMLPFLAMREKGHDLPATADAGRAQLFSDALGSISTAAWQVAFIPNADSKADMLKSAGDANAPKGMKDAAPVLANSKWMTLSMSLGTAPALSLAANTADADSAAKLAAAINAGLDDMKAKAANPDANGGPAAMLAPMVAGLADGLKPTTTGTHVAVTLDTQGLGQIVNLATMFMPRPVAAGHRPPAGAPNSQ